jgi:hypothetical protein
MAVSWYNEHMRTRLVFALAIIPILTFSHAQAHQPRVVEGGSPVQIIDPEISKAYYGELEGAPQIFRLESGDSFELYLNILVPDVPESTTDYSAQVRALDSGRIIGELNGVETEWSSFFEEFARDNYLMGPELRSDVSAGVYEIIVSSFDNEGAYVLAVGETESFTLSEIINAYSEIPTIKSRFFDKPSASAYLSPFLGGPLAILTVIIISVVWFIRRRVRYKKDRNK